MSASQAFAYPTSTPGYVPPPAGNTVDVTFDTNFPSSGSPLSYGSYLDSPAGWYSSILTVDGQQVGFMNVHNTAQMQFMGPVKFSWSVGTTHTYSWATTFSGTSQTWQFSSVSGLASDQSGTITVSSAGSITASYAQSAQPPPPSGPGPAAAPPPDCGGLYFQTPSAFPSGKCHHDNGDRYFLFKLGENLYYAVVREVYAGSYDYYTLQLSGKEVILDNSPGASYNLYVYDSGQNVIGSSTLGYGMKNTITITPPSPQPAPAPSSGGSNQFDGTWDVTFTYSVNGQTPSQMQLKFYVTNGVVSHPQNIFSGMVDSNGNVSVNYSECVSLTGVSNPGTVTGILKPDGTGTGTFTCGAQYGYGNWVATRTTNSQSQVPAAPPGQLTPARDLTGTWTGSAQWTDSFDYYPSSVTCNFSSDFELNLNQNGGALTGVIQYNNIVLQKSNNDQACKIGLKAPCCDINDGVVSSSSLSGRIGDGVLAGSFTTDLMSGTIKGTSGFGTFNLSFKAQRQSVSTSPQSTLPIPAPPPQQTTPTPQQSAQEQSVSKQPVNYKSYYNATYGFTLEYPDDWSYNQSFAQNGNGFVSFTPNDNSGNIVFQVVFIKDDINYRGLQGQDYLNKMIPDLSSGCSGSTFENIGYLCTDSKLLDSKVDNYHGGPAYSVAYSWKEKTKNGNVFSMSTAAQWIPDGDNRWVLAVVGTMDKFSQYKDEIGHMSDSFELDNYEPPSTESIPANNVGLQPVISASSQDIESINSAKDSQTIAAEVSVGNQNIQTKSIDNNVVVHTTNSASDSLNFSVSAPDQTGPKIIVFDLGNATINVANLKYLGVMYDGQKIDPAASIDAMIHAKSSDRPMFAIVVTQSGAQIMVLIPHFSTHTITITNMSKVIPAVPEFPFSILILLVAIIPIVLISRFKPSQVLTQ